MGTVHSIVALPLAIAILSISNPASGIERQNKTTMTLKSSGCFQPYQRAQFCIIDINKDRVLISQNTPDIFFKSSGGVEQRWEESRRFEVPKGKLFAAWSAADTCAFELKDINRGHTFWGSETFTVTIIQQCE